MYYFGSFFIFSETLQIHDDYEMPIHFLHYGLAFYILQLQNLVQGYVIGGVGCGPRQQYGH